jgi:hypothetical protein
MYQEKFGPIFLKWNGRKPRVYLTRPEDVEVRSCREIVVFTFIHICLYFLILTYFSICRRGRDRAAGTDLEATAIRVI